LRPGWALITSFAAASVAVACAGQTAFRPALSACPTGTRVSENEIAEQRDYQGNSYLEYERWCERPDGWRHGPYVSWDELGQSATEGNFRDGRRDGVWATYYWGSKSEEGRYVRGKMEGRWLSFDDHGHVTLVWTYRAGLIDGPAQTRCPNGVINSEGRYRANREEGRWISRFCSGQIEEVGHYRAGKVDGVWTLYDESGRKRWVRTYRDDMLDGRSIEWKEDGTKVEREYRMGQPVDRPTQGPASSPSPGP
jgi:antitoxin component YwqK of YwqJK toxin-antitoxin module